MLPHNSQFGLAGNFHREKGVKNDFFTGRARISMTALTPMPGPRFSKGWYTFGPFVFDKLILPLPTAKHSGKLQVFPTPWRVPLSLQSGEHSAAGFPAVVWPW